MNKTENASSNIPKTATVVFVWKLRFLVKTTTTLFVVFVHATTTTALVAPNAAHPTRFSSCRLLRILRHQPSRSHFMVVPTTVSQSPFSKERTGGGGDNNSSRVSRSSSSSSLDSIIGSNSNNNPVMKNKNEKDPHNSDADKSSQQVVVVDNDNNNNGKTNNNNNNNNSNNIINYHWTRQNLALALPAWMGLLADPLLGLVDTCFVARIGSVELAALGVCTSIYGMAFAVFHASTISTTSLVASAKSKDEQQHITLLSLKLALFLGTTLLLALRLGGTRALAGMGVGSTSLLYEPARRYLLTRCWAAPAVLSLVVAEGAFRGLGDTRIPLVASVTAALINLVLDPILMFGLGYGVAGAAAATAIAQYVAVAVYAYFLTKRNMLPPRAVSSWLKPLRRRILPRLFFKNNVSLQKLSLLRRRLLPRMFLNKRQQQTKRDKTTSTTTKEPMDDTTSISAPSFHPGQVLQTIMVANLSMLAKQFSLLVFYTYAAALATGFGVAHVAAHQVGLSLWLLFTWLLDAASVSGQVLMSRTCAEQNLAKVKSLTKYMVLWAIGQGLVTTLGMMFANAVVLPRFMKPDPSVQRLLVHLMPQLTFQQTLISLVLVLESLVIGGKQFYWMATGTTVCTLLAATRLHHATSVVTIWSQGFQTLFIARLISALFGTIRVIQNTAAVSSAASKKTRASSSSSSSPSSRRLPLSKTGLIDDVVEDGIFVATSA